MKKIIALLLAIVVILAVLNGFSDEITGFLSRSETVEETVSYTVTEKRTEPTTRGPAVEITDIGGPYKIYYQDLTEDEKYLYNDVLSKIYDMPESVLVDKVDMDQVERVFSALLYDNPDLIFAGRTNELITYDSEFEFFKQISKATVSINYIMSKSEYAYMKEELDAVCDKIIAGIPSDDEWEIEKYFHDYIIDNCSYYYEEGDILCNSAYGALVKGKSACEGYSKAMKLLLDKVGIKSAVVCGDSSARGEEAGPHMWNAVEIGGKWYYLDVTWDDPVNTESGKESREYYYFNVDSETLGKTHFNLYKEFDCTSLEENYFKKTGAYFEYYDRSCEEKIAQLVAGMLENGEDSLSIQFATKEAFDAAVADIVDNQRYYNIYLRADKLTDVNFSTTSTEWSSYDERYILVLIPVR